MGPSAIKLESFLISLPSHISYCAGSGTNGHALSGRVEVDTVANTERGFIAGFEVVAVVELEGLTLAAILSRFYIPGTVWGVPRPSAVSSAVMLLLTVVASVKTLAISLLFIDKGRTASLRLILYGVISKMDETILPLAELWIKSGMIKLRKSRENYWSYGYIICVAS